MANARDRAERNEARGRGKALPQPSTAFRRRAWLQFQRAIDPLAPPKPFKVERH